MPNQHFTNPYDLPIDSDGYCVDPETGKRVCGTEKNGGGHGFCKGAPMANHRCYKHGGKTPNGIASPHYAGKGYSRYLPQQVKHDYDYALDDPALIELRGEMALIEARMSAVLRQLTTGESGATWRAAQGAMRDLMAALQAQPPDPGAQAAALSSLRVTIDRGAGDYLLWQEIVQLADAKRKLIDSESRRVISAKQFITLDKAGLLFDALTTVVIENVQDRSTLARIQRQWNSLLNGSRESAVSIGEYDADRGSALDG